MDMQRAALATDARLAFGSSPGGTRVAGWAGVFGTGGTLSSPTMCPGTPTPCIVWPCPAPRPDAPATQQHIRIQAQGRASPNHTPSRTTTPDSAPSRPLHTPSCTPPTTAPPPSTTHHHAPPLHAPRPAECSLPGPYVQHPSHAAAPPRPGSVAGLLIVTPLHAPLPPRPCRALRAWPTCPTPRPCTSGVQAQWWAPPTRPPTHVPCPAGCRLPGPCVQHPGHAAPARGGHGGQAGR